MSNKHNTYLHVLSSAVPLQFRPRLIRLTGIQPVNYQPLLLEIINILCGGLPSLGKSIRLSLLGHLLTGA